MELRHLRYFVAVAEAMSFRKAAERLHMSQPPLSLQIQDLEYDIGADLFRRERRHISLTEAGRVFLPHAINILQAAEQAKSDALLVAKGRLGRLSIRFMSSAVAGTLQQLIVKFKRCAPLIELEIEQSNVEAIIRDVEAGNIDLGFIRLPVRLNKGIALINILRESYLVALQTGHRLSKKDSISPKDLRNEKLVIYPRHTACGSYDDILALFNAHGIVPDITQEAVEQLTIAGLVAAGIGYSIVPQCMAEIKVPGVVHRPLRGGKDRTGIAIVAKKPFTPLVSAFIEQIGCRRD